MLRSSALAVTAAAAAAAVVVVLYHRRRQHVSSSSSTLNNKKKKKLSLGVDFGGTCMKLCLVTSQHGFMQDSLIVNLPAGLLPTELIDLLVHNATTILLKRNQVQSFAELEVVGVCCPGRVRESNVVSQMANFPEWQVVEGVPLGDLLAARVGSTVSVKVFNDAKAALMGEVWSGSGAGSSNVCMITLGTGVGGAAWADGRILQGHTGMFGEVGHHIIAAAAMDNSSSSRVNAGTGVAGIAEEYCSARALEREYALLMSDSPFVSAKDILTQAAAAGDGSALAAVRAVARNVAVLVVNCCRMYDPEVVVLGGGLSNSKLLVREILAQLPQVWWTLTPVHTSVRVVPATHGNWAGAIGSVKLAMDG